MVKLMFINEENLPEIIFSERIFVDPEAPTDIIITVVSNFIRIRLRFTDVDEVNSFMELLFECDKINLVEIAKTSPDLEITVEDEPFPTMLASMTDGFIDEYYDDEEADPTQDSDYGE